MNKSFLNEVNESASSIMNRSEGVDTLSSHLSEGLKEDPSLTKDLKNLTVSYDDLNDDLIKIHDKARFNAKVIASMGGLSSREKMDLKKRSNRIVTVMASLSAEIEDLSEDLTLMAKY